MTTGRINQVAIFPRIAFQHWMPSTQSITYFIETDAVNDWSKLTLNQPSAKARLKSFFATIIPSPT